MLAVVCSTLPENLDTETRGFLVGQGVAPMQGLNEALNALASGAWYSARRRDILAHPPSPLVPPRDAARNIRLLDEAEAKALVEAAGVSTPVRRVVSGAGAPVAATDIGFPVVLKMVSHLLPHKTEAGAVRLGLLDAGAVANAVREMRAMVTRYKAEAVTDRFMVEAMVSPPVAELMVGIRREPQFGVAMTLATGGILVELIRDAVTVLLPASRDDLAAALMRLKLSRLIDGYRGKPAADRAALIDTLERLAGFASDPANRIEEIEINPLFAGTGGAVAVDVLIRKADGG